MDSTRDSCMDSTPTLSFIKLENLYEGGELFPGFSICRLKAPLGEAFVNMLLSLFLGRYWQLTISRHRD